MNKDSINKIEITTKNIDRQPYEWREYLKTTLRPFVNKPIANIYDGRVAMLPYGNIGKLSSETAVEKSKANGCNESEHFAAAEQILNLYKNAKLKEIQRF
ncbi:hypothetical protein DCO58_04645 [Helicobacter saguini]|uniref:Uncharacterized protein n=1 Tax=Helicobacter saguini TaxID=1548018 RepID=A0A347VSU6_9HELI|nr:hypothetical protein [Helicobacter saguini]MWV62358.1 hypothetical protein [Helicobacter saguini]MWV66971.1 hypothetical protein [Helicobacter saguini]MWV69319.1 hypothetical protein [Helicobacter saguini]MWV71126.1 hypothetical protein [Helicobacter saguini]TLD94980.1 hypothetical protein LS64_003410 [Helicobacter saguini]